MKKIIIAIALTIMIVLAVFLLEPTGHVSNKSVDNDKNYLEINETTIEEGKINSVNLLRVV